MNGDGGDNDEPPLLSQLIYSQSSLYNNGVDSIPAVATANNKAKQQQSVDEFYGLGPTQTATTTAKTSATSTTPITAGTGQAKRQMRRSRAKGRRGPELYLESQSQADDRQRAMKHHQQLAMIQYRWKQRKVDIRKEVDEGGVFEQLVRKHWKRKRTEAVVLSEQPIETYWEQGFRAPLPIPEIPNPSQLRIRKQNLPPEPKLNHFFPFSKTQKSTIAEVKHMVQRQHLLNCPVSGVHFHQGAVSKVIARSLVSGACASEEEQNKFLATLYKVNPNLRPEAVMREASHHGWNFQVFQRRLWQDRNAAAEQLLTINTRKRRSTHRGVMFDTEKSRRNKVIARLSGSDKDASSLQEMEAEEEDSVDSSDGSEDSGLDPEVIESNVSRDDACIDPHKDESFRFLSGAVPPKPIQPPDICSVQFGAEDPYAHAVRLARVKPATAELILATLLSRVANADKETLVEAHATMVSFLEHLLKRNKVCTTILINKYNKGVDIDVPAVAEYHAWMQYCRFAVNHRIASGFEGDEDPSEAGSLRRVNTVADELSLVLEEIQTRPGIKSFPRVHLIYAMCIIARELPPEAANIFARGDHKTPFHTVRLTLEFMEGNGMLTDDPSNATKSRTILAALLEHVFNEAAKVIETRCASITEEIDYHAWLLALRLSSFLLCSGVKIGGPAVRYASFRSKVVNVDSYFSQDSQPEHLPHEVRQRLPKYEETRIDAAEAMRSFLQLAELQQGARTSEMVVAILEWGQTIALIVGPSKRRGSTSPELVWQHIRVLHSTHMLEVSPLTASQLRELKLRDALNSNAIADKLALNLENDPSDISHWRNLVRELGPLGGSSKKCHKCQECKFLRKGFFVDHAEKEARKWWGRERLSWWKVHLLKLPPTPSSDPAFVFSIGQQMEQNLQREELEVSTTRESDTTVKVSRTWLDRIIITLNEQPSKQSQSIPSIESRGTAVNDLLPQPISKKPEPVAAECRPCIPGLDENERLEVLCYKIFLMAYLYGPNDEAVAEAVWFLASCHFGSQTKVHKEEFHFSPQLPPSTPQDAWRCIVWLASQGLFVSLCLLTFYKRLTSSGQGGLEMQGSGYSEETKEAMRLGVQCFGTKSLFTIRDNVPFFNSWDRKRLRRLYNAMKRHNEL
ncbi:hypothetical protein MHU86_1076 [Fragilaria crotonensis]|nr:hypothetical protein MHU86_1076 [Fragilaria crotonensis]